MPRTIRPTDAAAASGTPKGAAGTKTLDGGTAPNDTAAAILADLRRRLPQLTVGYSTVAGDPASALRQRAHSAHLYVVGAHRPGMEDPVRAARHGAEAHAGCPVVVSGGPSPRRGPVLLAVDRDGARRDVTDDAFALATRLGVPVRAVHAWTGPGRDRDGSAVGSSPVDADSLLAEVLAARASEFEDVPVERQIVHHADVAQALVDLSAQATALVVGARSAPGLGGGPLGATTSALLGRTRCPLVVVPWRRRPTGEW